MHRFLIPVVCAVAFAACGQAEQTPAPETTRPPTVDRVELTEKANAVCEDAQPAMDRAGKQIDQSFEDGNRAQSARERDRFREANGKAWELRHATMAKAFPELRALVKPGLDKPYDAFLSSWGRNVGYLEELGRAIGRDASVQELDGIHGLVTEGADELAGAAIAAKVLDCAAPYAPGGDPSNQDAETS
ncbi:hypothetical protein OJ997_21525 [Solirubrobacter phytolaccae]|uniref:Lipoprotein n=1 Tax=Solirubrobacter phytolaccae TaxID=1404360 RepID=A0A9X3NK88_9ACTN|nr:hypothetical protein [Solirubrobacter phytolaccae]MDA0182907.1 hypothetical protein [Solirubrobacter phytolaccae]